MRKYFSRLWKFLWESQGLWVNINGHTDIAFCVADGPRWWIKLRRKLYQVQWPQDNAWVSTILKGNACPKRS